MKSKTAAVGGPLMERARETPETQLDRIERAVAEVAKSIERGLTEFGKHAGPALAEMAEAIRRIDNRHRHLD